MLLPDRRHLSRNITAKIKMNDSTHPQWRLLMITARKKACYGVVLTLAAIFSGIIGCDFLASKPKRVVFLDNSFAVTMPATWSLRKDLNDSADLQMGNSFKEAYTVILSDNKMDLDNFSLDDHSDLTRSFIASGLKNYKASDPEYFFVGEYQAVRYRLEGIIEGIHAVYWHVTIETDNYFHQILLWSLKSRFSKNEDDFDSVIQSFEVI